jgi:exosortase A
MNPMPAHWRIPAALWLLLFGVLLFSQWSAALGMAEIWWRSDTYAHAMLVPPIAVWLVWRDRAALALLEPHPFWPGLLLLVLALLVSLFGQLAEINVLQHFAVVLSLQAFTLSLFGTAVTRRLAFPLLFLLFAPPFGEALTEPMMVMTADFTVAALRLSGIPVFREGLQFVIPSGNWSVVEACSGVRYLVASVMVGTLFAYLNFGSWTKRLMFIGVALLVPVVANWLRAYLIVMLGHHSGNTLAVGADHLFYGWVFFGIVMLIMFSIGARFADPARPQPTTAGTMVRAAVVRTAAPWLLAVTGVAMLLVPAQAVRSLRVTESIDPGALVLPAVAGHWRQEAVATEPPWHPEMDGSLQRLEAQWRAAEGPALRLSVGFWSPQRKDAKALSGMNVAVQAKDTRWSRDGQSQVAVDGLRMPQSLWILREAPLGQGGHVSRRLYWVDGHFTASERVASLLAVRQQLAGRGDAAALIVLMTPLDGGEARLNGFWREIRAPLNERLLGMAERAAGHNARP